MFGYGANLPGKASPVEQPVDAFVASAPPPPDLEFLKERQRYLDTCRLGSGKLSALIAGEHDDGKYYDNLPYERPFHISEANWNERTRGMQRAYIAVEKKTESAEARLRLETIIQVAMGLGLNCIRNSDGSATISTRLANRQDVASMPSEG